MEYIISTCEIDPKTAWETGTWENWPEPVIVLGEAHFVQILRIKYGNMSMKIEQEGPLHYQGVIFKDSAQPVKVVATEVQEYIRVYGNQTPLAKVLT